MEFLLTQGVAVSAQWSSEPLRRAVSRFRRDLEMTLNPGDLVPSGKILLCLSRELGPEQFTIDLQSAESMVICAADDLGAIYALLYLSRECLGIEPFWFWNDQRFEKKELVTFDKQHVDGGINTVGLRGWEFSGGQLLANWDAGAPGLNWEMAFEALLRCGGNFVALPEGSAASLARSMGLWRLQPAGMPLEAGPFDKALPGRSPLFADSAADYRRLWSAAVARRKHDKLIWRLCLPEQGGEILPPRPDRSEGDSTGDATLEQQRRGEQVSAILEAQYEVVREELPAAPICICADGEVAELLQAGTLDLPDDVIRLWPDNGHGKFVTPRQEDGTDLRTPALPLSGMPGRHGVFFHAASSDGRTGNCLTMLPIPVEQAARELIDAFELGARAMRLVCAGSIKPHGYPLDTLAELWRDLDADLNEHRTAYLKKTYRAPDGWALQPRQLDDLDTCLKAWPQATAAFGPWPDQCAGEQLMVCSARAVGAAWLAGRTHGAIPGLRWATGEKTFTEQVNWLHDICAQALPGMETLQAGCEYAARPTTRLWQDTLLAQTRVYRLCLQATVDLCDGWQHWANGEFRSSFLRVGRAAAGFEAARRVVAACADGRWKTFYQQEETNTDLSRTVWVLRALMALPRAAGDGPDYTGWQREALGPKAPASAMRDESLCAALEKAGLR